MRVPPPVSTNVPLIKRSAAIVALSFALHSCGGDSETGDPLFTYQWHLRNVGQRLMSDVPSKPGVDLHLGTLHEEGVQGQGVIIGLADTPIDTRHEDLVDNLIVPAEADPEPPTAHGTAMAGILVARGWNGVGGRGIAPQARLIDLSRRRDETAPRPDVINLSQGGAARVLDPAGLEWVSDMEAAADDGSIIVKAAGNDYLSLPDMPGSAALCAAATQGLAVGCLTSNADPLTAPRQVIAVTAVNALGLRASYSSSGSSTWIAGLGGQSGIDAGMADALLVAANDAVRRSAAIVTTDVSGCDAGLHVEPQLAANLIDQASSPIDPSCNYTARANGTSSAAPTVTGVIALMLQVRPRLGSRAVKQILARTARRIDPDDDDKLRADGVLLETGWTRNAAGLWFHNAYGFGLVDASAAVSAARSFEPPTSLVDLGWQKSDQAAVAIAGPSGPVAKGMTIRSEPVVVESVQVAVQTTHRKPSRLRISLVSPSGTRSVVLAPYSAMTDTERGFEIPIMATNAFLDEQAGGLWTMEVVDVDAGLATPAVVTGWQMRITGRAPQPR